MTVFILKLIPQVTGSPSVALRPAVSASSGNLLEIHILSTVLITLNPNPRDLTSNPRSHNHTKSSWSKAPSKDLNSANTQRFHRKVFSSQACRHVLHNMLSLLGTLNSLRHGCYFYLNLGLQCLGLGLEFLGSIRLVQCKSKDILTVCLWYMSTEIPPKSSRNSHLIPVVGGQSL